jgi:tetratricopeptide (TPR) repeat protein
MVRARVPANSIEALVRFHRLGLLSAQLSDHNLAKAYADSLNAAALSVRDSVQLDRDTLYSAEEVIAAAGDAALEVEALSAWLSGQPETALELLEGQNFEDVPQSEFHWVTARTFGRFLRAEILFELGDYEEAAGWYATIPRLSMGYHLEALLLAPVFRGRARALDSLGRYEEALHYYRRFVTRWQDADPHLQPQVEEARQRIRELEAELS